MKTACLVAAGLLSLPLAAQMPDGYLDIDMIKVKMGKRMDFDAINKRMVEMNRKKGDHWTAYEVVYGDSNAIYFVQPRATYAAAWEGMKTYEDAVKKAVGEAGMHKLFSDWDAMVESEHETLYRRRWDLSSNAPANLADSNKRVAQSHWIFVQTTHIRPGKGLVFETELRRIKEARERMGADVSFSVSQAVAGGRIGTYRSASLMKSLADMDSVKSIPQVLGDAAASYRKTMEDASEGSESEIGRYVPELSNPPDEVVALDPAFWRPKPAPTAAPKAKPAAKQ